jgi:hypothetical protein
MKRFAVTVIAALGLAAMVASTALASTWIFAYTIPAAGGFSGASRGERSVRGGGIGCALPLSGRE